MENWFETTPTLALEIVISCFFIYLATILFTRIFGKRSFSKLSNFDFAMTIATGSLIATTILSPTTSILEGTIGILLIFILQFSVAFFRRYPFFSKIINNTPLLLMDGETILYKNLRKARITEQDLRSKLRGANIIKLSQVLAVVFETTGDIIVPKSENEAATVEPWLMNDVIK